MESLRIALAIIVVLGLHLFQLDFKGAFLNSPITHNIYMEQLEGFIKQGEEHLVCKLTKLSRRGKAQSLIALARKRTDMLLMQAIISIVRTATSRSAELWCLARPAPDLN